MKNTGTAELYASLLVGNVQAYGPQAVVAAFFVLTSALSNFINKNAAAVLMTPVAIAAGVGMGLQPMPFVMAVLFGASACFATPVGYQTNLFIYGPGGYRFADYMKLGLPLIVVLGVIAIYMIPIVWPFVPLA
jgi:di/tricarboxylate transporter